MYIIQFQSQKLQNTLRGLNFEVMHHKKFKPQDARHKSQEFKWLPLLCMSLVTSLYDFRHFHCTLCVDCSLLSASEG